MLGLGIVIPTGRKTTGLAVGAEGVMLLAGWLTDIAELPIGAAIPAGPWGPVAP